MQVRPQSITQEIGHGFELQVALAAAPVLIVVTALQAHAADVVGACVFAVTMVLLYLSSVP